MLTFIEFITESPADDKAKKMGLTHHGYGRYGKDNGDTTHVAAHGKLTPISKVKHLETLHGGQLKHLEHADDEVFNNGAHGVRNIVDHIHGHMHGDSRVKMSQKIDGSPSVVFGTHPETGKYFVASKSAFNKDPKINYTDEDVDRNHGHAPGLASKLKSLLKHGHKLGVHGVVQGDMLYDQNDKHDEGDKVSFKPNTIKYSIKKNHEEGKKVARSKIGVAIHTQYDKDGKAVLNPEIPTKSHPDVYNMPVSVHKDKMKFDHDKLKGHTSAIGHAMHKIPKEGWDAVTKPEAVEHVKTYINQKVRQGKTDYNVPEMMKHVHGKYQKEIDKVKTDKAKGAKAAERDAILGHMHTHSQHFEHAFEIQHHINEAKHHIIDRLNKNQTFEHHYENGEKAHPEGYVSIGHHGPVKFVNRGDFSKANFEMSANRK